MLKETLWQKCHSKNEGYKHSVLISVPLLGWLDVCEYGEQNSGETSCLALEDKWTFLSYLITVLILAADQ